VLPADIASLTVILDDLRAAAALQAAADFDPSGTGALGDGKQQSSGTRTTPEETTTSNDVTSVTTGLTELDPQESGYVEKDLENLPRDQQQEWLKNLFPSIAINHVFEVLDHCATLEQAVDELLNLSFVEENIDDAERQAQDLPKGIDGFAEGLRQQNRKGRSKMKARTTASAQASSNDSYSESSVPGNVWNTAIEDVEFICSRTKLQPQNVRSIYHANGARLSLTIKALADREATAYAKIEKPDEVLKLQIAEVKTDFSYISDAQIYGLLTLARNIPSAARELLEAMTANPSSITSTNLTNIAQYTPSPTHLQADTTTSPVRSWTKIPTPHTSSTHLSYLHSSAAHHAFTQASSAYRRSKSKPHYSGAAAYYSSVAHENLLAAKSHQQSIANAHVAAQSCGDVLDLQGVAVADGVRIALERAQTWWEELGDGRYISGGGGRMRQGLRIVVGVGTHSKGGRGRLGPAVAKALVREGWRVEVDGGEVRVTGKARR
jgi:hypothetical protein